MGFSEIVADRNLSRQPILISTFFSRSQIRAVRSEDVERIICRVG